MQSALIWLRGNAVYFFRNNFHFLSFLSLAGMSADLLHLSQRNHLAGQYAEGDRVLALRAAVEASIDADLRDNSSELVCGRGRRRLDNLQVIFNAVCLYVLRWFC